MRVNICRHQTSMQYNILVFVMLCVRPSVHGVFLSVVLFPFFVVVSEILGALERL